MRGVARANESPMSRAELSEMAVRAKTDQAVRDHLTEHLLRLISSAAKRYRNTLGEDALGEAAVAFLEAIDSFDPEAGDFRTWAVCNMWLKLSFASRREAAYKARMVFDDPQVGFDGAELPDLLGRAWKDGAITEEEARVIMGRANGETAEAIQQALGISRMTYFRRLKSAMEALQAYVR